MTYGNITFMSDFGAQNELVGICKSVIHSVCADANVIDLAHDIERFDIRAGSLTLVRAAHYLVPGIVIAAVDPASAQTRRSIAVEVGDGESVLLGPDNGLLAPVVAMVGGTARVFELNNPKFHLDSPGRVLCARDVFAPAAGHLCNGVSLAEMGDELDASTLVPGMVPFSGEKDSVLHADVVWIDHFGNAELNATAEQVAAFGGVLDITHGTTHLSARVIDDYGQLHTAELGVMVDSNGMLALVSARASAAERHSITVGDALVLKTQSH